MFLDNILKFWPLFIVVDVGVVSDRIERSVVEQVWTRVAWRVGSTIKVARDKTIFLLISKLILLKYVLILTPEKQEWRSLILSRCTWGWGNVEVLFNRMDQTGRIIDYNRFCSENHFCNNLTWKFLWQSIVKFVHNWKNNASINTVKITSDLFAYFMRVKEKKRPDVSS